ncbi:MAG TPA: RNA polymerase sigma factor [bacterium]|nr:RNA polymerase sigma factor [bacterium]
MDEKDLVERILKGEEKAKNQFFNAYKEQLYRVCASLLGYRDPDAQDVVQETFLTAFQKLGEFEFRSGLATWLTRICVYKTYQQIEKRKRDLARAHEDLEILSRPSALREQDAQQEKEERRIQLELVARCLEKLKEECRRIVALRDREGESYVSIGKSLGLPIGTVMSRLARCKKALKTLVLAELEGKENE